MKIVCVEPLGISGEKFKSMHDRYQSMGHRLEYYMDRREDEATLVDRMHEADIVVISNIKLTAAVLSRCPRLKYISVAFTGLDHIDLDYCAAQGIRVQNAAGYSTTAVSELALALMLDLLRGVTATDGAIRHGGSRGTMLGGELRGRTVGIVGTGAIGTATARLALAFGARVVAFSRTERDDVMSMGVEYMPLDKLLRQADIVSLHVPLCEATRGLIGRERLMMMKPSALLVNTARGPVCDIEAVADALHNGRLAGAAFDVFEHEPPLAAGHPLLSAPRCICTPHIAFATNESFEARAGIVFGHVDDYLLN